MTILKTIGAVFYSIYQILSKHDILSDLLLGENTADHGQNGAQVGDE